VLYLASQSPRRRQLLEQIGLTFKVLTLDLPEVRLPDESAEQYVTRVAHEKALGGLRMLNNAADAIVLGADSEVVVNDDVFGKPADAADAAAMLRRLSGRTHRVLSAVWCVSAAREEFAMNVTDVTFETLSGAQIADYVASGEPMGRAGAYAIQGLAATFVKHIAGSYTGVMGLPLFETAQLLRRFEP
jgi:septum formation protein